MGTAAAIAFLVSGCAAGIEADAAPPAPLPGASAAVDTVRLRVRDEADLRAQGLRIRFAGVESDSRCPVDVQCVWEGDAVVILEIGGPGAAPLRLHTANRRATLHGQHRFELIDLLPRPRVESTILPEQYRVEIAVSRSVDPG